MTRPTYDNADLLKHEDEIRRVLEKHFHCNLHKLPIRYFAYWLAVRGGRVVAVMEFKSCANRDVPFSKWTDKHLSVAKIITCLSLANSFNVKFLLVCEFIDLIAYIHIDETVFEYDLTFANNYRNDSQDVEPMLMLPMNKFKIIKRK